MPKKEIKTFSDLPKTVQKKFDTVINKNIKKNRKD